MSNKPRGTRAREQREVEIGQYEDHLYTTGWGKYFARPSQVRAGAKKLRDVVRADERRLTIAAR
jgi:hypothetical protein